MATFKRFEDIEAWQLARDLCKLVFKVTSKSEFAKDFTLKDQIKRSSGSSMDNIAEGYERDGTKEFINFLSISRASAAEVRSQSYRALDFGYITEAEFKEIYTLAERVSKADYGLMNYLKNCELKGIKWK